MFGKIVRVGAAACTLLVMVQANAADLANTGGSYKDGPAAVPTWTGFYVGANGGYGWRQTSNLFAYTNNLLALDTSYAGIGAEGGFGGGQIGYNVQGFFGMPALVAGIEADFQGADISGKGLDLHGEAYKTSLDWFGTVRGRVGYASSNVMAYFTGGFAYGGLKHYGEDAGWTPTAVYKFDSTVTGYVLGGGIEYKLNPTWSLKAEYQYLNFGRHDAPLASGDPLAFPTALADGFRVSGDAFHTVRIGVNYWVNPAYEPLK